MCTPCTLPLDPPLGLRENTSTLQESWLWANRQLIRKKTSLETHKINMIANKLYIRSRFPPTFANFFQVQANSSVVEFRECLAMVRYQYRLELIQRNTCNSQPRRKTLKYYVFSTLYNRVDGVFLKRG